MKFFELPGERTLGVKYPISSAMNAGLRKK
jgi:hypothetical protein